MDSNALTAQKRKRGDGKAKVQRLPLHKSPPLDDLLRAKLHHGVREVKSAAKKAKDFEIRRAIKRLKNAKKQPSQSGDNLGTLGKELDLLKKLDHEAVALVALRTKLNKDHLSKNPSFHTTLQTVIPRLSSPSLFKGTADDLVTTQKVESRLLSSKVLADAIRSILYSLRAVVETPATASGFVSDDESGPSGSESGETRLRQETAATVSGKKQRARNETNKESRFMASLLSDEDDGDGTTAEAAEDDAASWESGSVASSSDVIRPASKLHKGLANSDLGDSAESGSESEEGIDPDALGDMGSDEEDDENGPSERNHFLPSLQVGFTPGESDTESWKGKDDEDAAGDKKRRNRRGQRARQAIWEKKYGGNAKHVKKRREEEKALGEAKALAAKARATKRMAAVEDDSNGRGRGRGRGLIPPSSIPTRLDGGWKGGAENRNASARKQSVGTGAHAGKGAKSATASEKLHPSWEAKRKQKEKELIGIVPSQGKKIKF